MLNKYPLWKNLLILAVVLLGLFGALPNIFGQDPAVVIRGVHGIAVNDTTRQLVSDALHKAQVPVKRIDMSKGQLLVRFPSSEDQLRGQEAITNTLPGTDFSHALTLTPDVPAWLSALGGQPMNLGLDLRGGVHVLIDVDMESAISDRLEAYAGELRSFLRQQKLRYLSVDTDKTSIFVKFRSAEERDRAEELLGNEYRDLGIETQDAADGYVVRLFITPAAEREIRRAALEQNITTIRNRVNALGVAEPIVQQQGARRIVVELPGVQDPTRVKELLSATATLEYRLVDTEHDVQDAVNGRVPPGSRLYKERKNGRPILLKRRVIVTGDQMVDARAGFDQRTGSPMVSVTLDGKGAKRMRDVTTENVGRPMAVVFKEGRVVGHDAKGKPITQWVEEVISVANILEPFGRRFQTTGLDSPEEAHQLALLLRAGALAAPIQIVEERTVGPSLGQDNINQGLLSVVIGLLLVMGFMVLYYRMFGMLANLALLVNLVLIVAALSVLQATLTLPGIAGIVLTVGMAVDANVLIFERIREELRVGNTPQASIHAGYDRALSTITDSNLTTLIAAVVLFSIGSGPVRGFAVTLAVGIITSMFTAILGTRAVVNLVYGGKRVKKLSIGNGLAFTKRGGTMIDVMGKRKFAMAASGTALIIAVIAMIAHGLNFGIDFTGGTLIEVGYQKEVPMQQVRSDLTKAGFNEAAVQQFGTPRDFLIRLPSGDSNENATLGDRVLHALNGPGGSHAELRRVEFVGPQVGNELAEDGFLGVLVSLMAILVYVALRFEWRFAVGSVIALIHDVVFTVGWFALFYFVFDLQVLAAILAVIGYSLNDTIVVYDRIRENFRKMRKGSPIDVVNTSLNQTFSRTLITSFTTILVLLALFLVGGEVIHGFALALLIGVFVGTYSSIYIASAAAVALGVSKEDLMPVKKEGALVDDRP